MASRGFQNWKPRVIVILTKKYLEENNKSVIFLGETENKSNVIKVPEQNKYSHLPITHPELEALDPNPDIHLLFCKFSVDYFFNKLGSVEVKWSKRMTLCAGLCRYTSSTGHCIISLSEPLLRFRPRKNLVETLLHEMIHAYLFVSHGNRDHSAHGPIFLSHMNRINKMTGTEITIYHKFHDEVNFYKQHWWRCDGPCRNKSPFFGYCKRSMNRAPGPYDSWWSSHKATCSGKFHKIHEPPPKDQKKLTQKAISKYKLDNFYSQKV